MRQGLLLLFCICFFAGRSQEQAGGYGAFDSTVLQKRNISANFIKGEIKIDGNLSEAQWMNAEKADRFIQYAPNPGKASRHQSEVWIMYDNNALYVGAWLHDVDRDSIIRTLST